jgi:hypothetical protein
MSEVIELRFENQDENDCLLPAQDSVRNAWSIGEEPAPEPPKVASLPSPQSSSEGQVSVHQSSGWEVIRSAKPLPAPAVRSRMER